MTLFTIEHKHYFMPCEQSAEVLSQLSLIIKNQEKMSDKLVEITQQLDALQETVDTVQAELIVANEAKDAAILALTESKAALEAANADLATANADLVASNESLEAAKVVLEEAKAALEAQLANALTDEEKATIIAKIEAINADVDSTTP